MMCHRPRHDGRHAHDSGSVMPGPLHFTCPVPGCDWEWEPTCHRSTEWIESKLQAHFDTHGLDAEFITTVLTLSTPNRGEPQ